MLDQRHNSSNEGLRNLRIVNKIIIIKWLAASMCVNRHTLVQNVHKFSDVFFLTVDIHMEH